MDVVWWSILLFWSPMAAAIYAQQQFVSKFEADHRNERAYRYLLLMAGSVILAGLDDLVLAYYIYSAYGLFWTLVLCFAGSLLAGVVLGMLYAFVDELLLTLAACTIWPTSAGCIYPRLGWSEP